jgi:hypothetical protein
LSAGFIFHRHVEVIDVLTMIVDDAGQKSLECWWMTVGFYRPPPISYLSGLLSPIGTSFTEPSFHLAQCVRHFSAKVQLVGNAGLGVLVSDLSTEPSHGGFVIHVTSSEHTTTTRNGLLNHFRDESNDTNMSTDKYIYINSVLM